MLSSAIRITVLVPALLAAASVMFLQGCVVHDDNWHHEHDRVVVHEDVHHDDVHLDDHHDDDHH